MKLRACFKHLKTILIHKFWVFHYCRKAGIIWQGIIHDLSKFSPTEFFESVKYYTGTSSPINECKKANGYSEAWLHHRGRNKHHYEYWTDNYDSGVTAVDMPFKYQLEMLCDYLGASRAYQKKPFSIDNEIKWWDSKKDHAKSMSIKTKTFIDIALYLIKTDESLLNYNCMKQLYLLINVYKIYDYYWAYMYRRIFLKNIVLTYLKYYK